MKQSTFINSRKTPKLIVVTMYKILHAGRQKKVLEIHC